MVQYGKFAWVEFEPTTYCIPCGRSPYWTVWSAIKYSGTTMVYRIKWLWRPEAIDRLIEDGKPKSRSQQTFHISTTSTFIGTLDFRYCFQQYSSDTSEINSSNDSLQSKHISNGVRNSDYVSVIKTFENYFGRDFLFKLQGSRLQTYVLWKDFSGI